MRILFIGNSHTYYNDLPAMVSRIAKEDGIDCAVTMIAHGGWFLEQHVNEPEVRFNILHGEYDYVVLQEHSHPFPEYEKYYHAVESLNEWIKEAGSKTVIYATWAKKSEPNLQEMMDTYHEKAASALHAILAPVGKKWWQYQKFNPQDELYYEDGAHASSKGSMLAAHIIWSEIKKDMDVSENEFAIANPERGDVITLIERQV